MHLLEEKVVTKKAKKVKKKNTHKTIHYNTKKCSKKCLKKDKGTVIINEFVNKNIYSEDVERDTY